MKVRRLLASAGVIALASAGATIALTGVASAHSNAVVGQATCHADGTYSVTWTITNDFDLTEVASVQAVTPPTSSTTASSVNIGKKGTGAIIQVAIPGSSTQANVNIHGLWSDGFHTDDTGHVDLAGTCTPLVPATPVLPTATVGTCTLGVQGPDTLTIPDTTGIDYRIAGQVVTGVLMEPYGTTVVVTATAQPGYVMPTAIWSHSFTFPVALASCSVQQPTGQVVKTCDSATFTFTNPTVDVTPTPTQTEVASVITLEGGTSAHWAIQRQTGVTWTTITAYADIVVAPNATVHVTVMGSGVYRAVLQGTDTVVGPVTVSGSCPTPTATPTPSPTVTPTPTPTVTPTPSPTVHVTPKASPTGTSLPFTGASHTRAIAATGGGLVLLGVVMAAAARLRRNS